MHPIAVFFIALALGAMSIYHIIRGMMLLGVLLFVIAAVLLAFTLPEPSVKKKKK